LSLLAPFRICFEALSRPGGSASRDREESRYRELAGKMTDLITRHGLGGAVMFASPAAGPILGVEPRRLRGNGLFDRVHVADRPAYLTALADAAALREGRAAEFRARRGPLEPGAGARFIWLEMRCHPLDRVAGEGTEVVAVMRDVTQRKDAEQAIEEARAEAERASLAKSRFLATMSHELRTPLNAIIGFSDMLREESLMIDPRRRRDYAQLINESGRHLLAVVNDILDMSKIETGRFEIFPEPVAAARVIGECCELLTLRARRVGVELLVALPVDLPQVMADKRALNQIMLNLLSNAVKFSERGGRVVVAANVEPEHMVITVEDTGVGIEADDLPCIGDPFFQARSSYDRRHDGAGLGMSIVKGLVALHGGSMQVESRIGEGTRITVRLPLDGGGARGCDVSMLGRLPPRPSEPATETLVRKRA
jgi:cell cycle sensor histidine kinase DivJ